jgi:hypothetical protein
MLTLDLSEIITHIGRIFENGFGVDDDTWHYLQTTFIDPTPSSVAALVNDADDCESDSLTELLFYPDEAMQVFLEPTIESTALTLKDQENIIALLLSQSFHTKLLFHTSNETVDIRMPELAVRKFVSRLNLIFRLPEKLVNIIDDRLPEDLGKLIKVHLRNSNIDLADHHVELLGLFLTKLDYTHPDYRSWIDFGLSILPEITSSTRIYEFFMDKKNFYLQSIEKAELFLEKLRHSNMETLMMQHERAAFMPPEKGREVVAHIDQICWAIFGYSDNFQPVKKDEINLNHIEFPQDLIKVINFLS